MLLNFDGNKLVIVETKTTQPNRVQICGLALACQALLCFLILAATPNAARHTPDQHPQSIARACALSPAAMATIIIGREHSVATCFGSTCSGAASTPACRFTTPCIACASTAGASCAFTCCWTKSASCAAGTPLHTHLPQQPVHCSCTYIRPRQCCSVSGSAHCRSNLAAMLTGVT